MKIDTSNLKAIRTLQLISLRLFRGARKRTPLHKQSGSISFRSSLIVPKAIVISYILPKLHLGAGEDPAAFISYISQKLIGNQGNKVSCNRKYHAHTCKSRARVLFFILTLFYFYAIFIEYERG